MNNSKPKSEDEQFKETMDQNISWWDIDKNMTGAVLRSEALEKIDNRELKVDVTFKDDDFSDDNSFFDSEDENMLDCMDDDVFPPNVPERYSNSEPVKPTTKNELTIRKACCKGLIACQYFTSGHGLPYFGKWIDVEETCMPHLTSAKDFFPVSAAEGTFSGNSVATELHQETSITGSRKIDRIDVSLKSLREKCENLKESFLTSPADDAHRKATKNCEKTAAKANADGSPEASKAKKLTTAKLGGTFFAKIWKERVVAKTDNRQNENEDSNISATIGGSGDTIQEGETVFGASRQQLAPATFKMLENLRVDAEIAVADESITEDVFDNSTAEDLVMSNAIVDCQDASAVGSRDVASGLVQMKLEEPDYSERETWLKRENEITAGRNQESGLDIGEQDWPLERECKKNSPLNLEPQLLHSSSDGILRNEQIVQSAIQQSLMFGQSKVSSAEEVFFGESELECEVLHIQKGKFHDDKFLSLSKANDLDLKFPIVGEVACAFDIGEDVVAKHLESSYAKQKNERVHSSDFEVKKTIGIDRNHFLMCLSGREEIVHYRRELSCISSTTLLRATDGHRGAELEYPELCKLLFGKQRVSRKEKWNKLKLENQSNRLVWRKRKKRLKNETGGGHPFKHRRNKEELNKDSKLRW